MRFSLEKTGHAFIWMNILRSPFWTIYGLLVFILYKDLHATSFQVALFLALKPIVSLFSIYWSMLIRKRSDRLISNIIIAGITGHLPFLFFPFFNNVWFFIFSGALYMFFTRGVVPAWMELLRANVPPVSRERVFSSGSAISYAGAIIFPLLIGDLFDTYEGIWRWFFPISSILSLSSLLFLIKVPMQKLNDVEKESLSLIQQIFKPWKITYQLCLKHYDFRQFQIGFFFGGMGLMLMQPALPKFFFQSLNLSYAGLAMAFSICKSIGFIVTTKFWANLMGRMNIFKFSFIVCFFAAVFPLLLMLAHFNLLWLYVSYLIYGVMQAGSELSWHLSGPFFAKEEESSSFSSVNVLTVGLRGCIAPFLGSLLCSKMNAMYVLVFSSLLCLQGGLHMRRHAQKKFILN